MISHTKVNLFRSSCFTESTLVPLMRKKWVGKYSSHLPVQLPHTSPRHLGVAVPSYGGEVGGEQRTK